MAFTFRQLFDRQTCTYTYLLMDTESSEAALIDPVAELMDRDSTLIQELGLDLKYVIETHIHADHVTSSGKLKEKTGAALVLGKKTGVDGADIYMTDGETLKLGAFEIRAIETPGHTSGCTSFYVEGHVFTGDALLVRGCGRTDFQEGSAEVLFSSVRDKLFALPDETVVCPGHDYQGRTRSSIGEEKQFNIRLRLDIGLQKFVRIMGNLQLDPPQKIDVAVPANQKFGLVER